LSVLTILAIYNLGKTLSGWKVGLVSALILALSPFQIQFAQETRSYALLTLNACLSMGMAARLMSAQNVSKIVIGSEFRDFFGRQQSPPPQGRQGFVYTMRRFWACAQNDLSWTGYIVFTALAVYTHNIGFFLLLGINLFVFGLMFYRRFHPARAGQLQSPGFKNWVAAQIGMGLLWRPWAPVPYKQMPEVGNNFWIHPPTFSLVINTLKNLLLAWVPARLTFIDLIWLAFAGIFLLSGIKNRDRIGHFIFLAALFLTPFLGELLVSLFRPIFYDRTLIWSAIPLYILMAEGNCQLRFRPYIVTALVILVTLDGLSFENFYRCNEKERWDLAANYVGENIQPGDVIIFNANWAEIPFDYYFSKNNSAIREYGAPETMFELGIFEPHMTRADLPRLRSIIDGQGRVWLVYSHNWWTDPDSLIQKELGARMSLKEVRTYNGMQIRLYEQSENEAMRLPK
jgi:hypothetical protein